MYFENFLEKLWYQLLKSYNKKEMMYSTKKKMDCKGRKVPKLSKQESQLSKPQHLPTQVEGQGGKVSHVWGK